MPRIIFIQLFLIRITTSVSLYNIYLLFSFYRDEDNKKGAVPETRVGEEGTAKRNIQRRHDHDPNRKEKPQHGGGVGGKGQWNDIDDGTLP
jgi:hypothetical protein